MLKKFAAALAALFLAAAAYAAVDANKASQAELEAIKGIGPVISTLIINERKKGEFKDWNDLVVRVKGVGDRSAEKFSEGGLTVNGKAYAGAPATPAKATTAAKAGSAVKSDARAEAKAETRAEKKAAKEAKTEKAEAKSAAASAAKK